MLGIHPQPHGDFDGLVKFREFDLLQQGHSVFKLVRTRFYSCARLGDVLSCFFHQFFLSPTVQRCFAGP